MCVGIRLADDCQGIWLSGKRHGFITGIALAIIITAVFVDGGIAAEYWRAIIGGNYSNIHQRSSQDQPEAFRLYRTFAKPRTCG